MRGRSAVAAVAVGALGLLGSAQACWPWQTDWSTACECERPCWCLVPDETITPGAYTGPYEDYYLCDNCPCRTEGLFNPGDGPVLGDPGWPRSGEDTSSATEPATEPVLEEEATTEEEQEIITEDDVLDVVDDRIEDLAAELYYAWESPWFS